MGVHFEFLCYFSQLLVIVFLLKISDDMLNHSYTCTCVLLSVSMCVCEANGKQRFTLYAADDIRSP